MSKVETKKSKAADLKEKELKDKKFNSVVDLSDDAPVDITEKVRSTEPTQDDRYEKKYETNRSSKGLKNCLRDETIIIKYVDREGGMILDKNHVLYGGLSDQATITLTVPQLTSGTLVNVLTNDEKAYLEYVMGLPENALSIYKKVDNYWDNRVYELRKGENILRLDNPDDFIKYKIALANSNIVASSLEELKEGKKASYRFVITSEEEKIEESVSGMEVLEKAFMLYSEYKENSDVLLYVLRVGPKKIFNNNTKKNIIIFNLEKFIKEKPEEFVSILEDKYLQTKIEILKAVKAGSIRMRANHYYVAKTNQPLCDYGKNPTIESAAEFVNRPENQEILFLIQASGNN